MVAPDFYLKFYRRFYGQVYNAYLAGRNIPVATLQEHYNQVVVALDDFLARSDLSEERKTVVRADYLGMIPPPPE